MDTASLVLTPNTGDAAICITVLYISNDLCQNKFPCRVDEHYIRPKGKHGCAVNFHFSKSEQNVLPRVQTIQVAVCPSPQ